MGNQVVFEEDIDSAFQRLPIRSVDQRLVERGVAHTVVNAKLMLVLLVIALIGGAFYFLASAIPETPKLGQDVPRAGEKILRNRSI